MTKDDLILYLGIALGILSVLNKLLLLKARPTGWVSGMAIGLLSCVYFYSIGLIILALAEIGFFLVMLFGYLSRSLDRPGNIMRAFSIILTGALIGLSVVLFTGKLTAYQLLSSLAFIWGAFALAKSWPVMGWPLFIVAHVATSLAAYIAAQQIFAGLQIASAVVCLLGLVLSVRRQPVENDLSEGLVAKPPKEI